MCSWISVSSTLGGIWIPGTQANRLLWFGDFLGKPVRFTLHLVMLFVLVVGGLLDQATKYFIFNLD